MTIERARPVFLLLGLGLAGCSQAAVQMKQTKPAVQKKSTGANKMSAPSVATGQPAATTDTQDLSELSKRARDAFTRQDFAVCAKLHAEWMKRAGIDHPEYPEHEVRAIYCRNEGL